MNTKEANEIIEESIIKFGQENNELKAIEEMAELTKELIKKRFGKGSDEEIVDEIADVTICIDRLARLYGQANVNERIRFKLKRLKGIIDAAP